MRYAEYVCRKLGDTPSCNFSDDYREVDPKKPAFPGGYDEISRGNTTCYNCALACRRVVGVKNEASGIEEKVEGPEYETQAALGSDCGVTDIKVVAKANDLCNRYGLDTISAGCTIAFAMECYEKGIVSREETDDIDLKFGNGDGLAELVERISFRKGFGNIDAVFMNSRCNQNFETLPHPCTSLGSSG